MIFIYAWKEVENYIHFGMIFKKMYCHKCGTRLVKNKYVNIILKGDFEYKKYKIGYFGEGKVTQYKYNYKCPNCNNIIDYKQQVEISKIQKTKSKKILSDDDINIKE